MAKRKKKTGRPLKKIDPEQVKNLAAIGCTLPEMAAVLKCSKMTLSRRFVATIKEGQEHLKASLRRMQYESAQKGNVAMLIWLGKQYLGQKDEAKTEQTGELKLKVVYEDPKHEGQSAAVPVPAADGKAA